MAHEGNSTKIYTGRIAERDHGEAMDIIFLDNQDKPLAAQIQDDLGFGGRRTMSVSYFVTDEPRTKAELEDNLIRTLVGDLEVEYTAHYSEYTGYLWTDEELNVGGHDLLAEIRSHVGKYLHLEIAYGGPG